MELGELKEFLGNKRRVLEDVFVTEGVPQETFIDPPNFNQIFLDVRTPGKPVVIEGPSGTGKTTTVKKIFERLGQSSHWVYTSARKPEDLQLIVEFSRNPTPAILVIDDFHRLHPEIQARLSDIAKVAAEEGNADRYPKLVLIGINQVGAALTQFSPDIAKRCGIHRIQPADADQTLALVTRGAEALNIAFSDPKLFFAESQGDYWLTQTLCSTACAIASVLERQQERRMVSISLGKIRQQIVARLEAAYYECVKDFCRGRRFRPSNDPYYRILRFIATKGTSSNVDLVELANANVEIAGSINNIKDSRLNIVLAEKPRAGQYFYYNKSTARFSIEDPAVFYFLKNLDWDKLRADCGFRDHKEGVKQFDIAISFSGERRDLARHLSNRLRELDVSIFFDEDFESKFLGRRMGEEFEQVFSQNSRFVVCLLDEYHRRKLWPTFERDVFTPRVLKGEVIPIYLDDTKFPGIPDDLYGIRPNIEFEKEGWQSKFDNDVILPIIDRIA